MYLDLYLFYGQLDLIIWHDITNIFHTFIYTHSGMFATEYVADGLFHNTTHIPYVSLCDLICYSESYECKKKDPMSYS